MAYYGTGYSQGVGGQQQDPMQSYQGAIPLGFLAPQQSPTADSQVSANQSGVANKIAPSGLGTLTTPGFGGAISETNNLANINPWASQYITDLAGKGASSGQLNDAYYKGAPTLGAINTQYGSNFDPSKFTGLGDGSLTGLQNSLKGLGYGLDNIGGYYQDQSINKGPQSGVDYAWDPNFGVTGSIGGLNFDVASAGEYQPQASYSGADPFAAQAAFDSNPFAKYFPNGQVPSNSQIMNTSANDPRAFQSAGSGFHTAPNATQGASFDYTQNGRGSNDPNLAFPFYGRAGQY